MQSDSCVEFPSFRLDLANHELWRGGQRLALRPKPFASARDLRRRISRRRGRSSRRGR